MQYMRDCTTAVFEIQMKGEKRNDIGQKISSFQREDPEQIHNHAEKEIFNLNLDFGFFSVHGKSPPWKQNTAMAAVDLSMDPVLYRK